MPARWRMTPSAYSATNWGAWRHGPGEPTLATGGHWTAAVWRPMDPSQGHSSPLTELNHPVAVADPDGFQINISERMEWGVWSDGASNQMLALGGTRPGGGSGLWLWLEDTGVLAEFETGDRSPPLWGAWGLVDGEDVLATGDATGQVRLWDPQSLKERLALPPSAYEYPAVNWGAWIELDGEWSLVVGGQIELHVFPPAALRGDFSSTVGPSPGTTETTWGAWGQVEGSPVLAFGGAFGFVRLVDQRTSEHSYIELDRHEPGTTWGTWAERDGESILVVGDQYGRVWFCDPVGHTAQRTSLGREVSWGAWGRLDGKAVLAVGSNQDVLLYDLVWERVTSRVPRYRSDTGGAVDLLGRRSDAAALADLITARSAQPPLAVGLFGQWGDGKSMFLEMLQEQVAERARTAGTADPIAHGNIRQVRFNAWHYAEADLWASLVAELFAQLSDGADPAREQRQRSRLASELVQARGLREQLGAAEERLADLRQAEVSEDSGWASLAPSARLRLQDLLGANAEKLYREAALTSSTVRRTARSAKRLLKAISWRGWLAAVAGLAAAGGLVIWGPGVVRWLAAVPAIVAVAATVREGWSRIGSAGEAVGSAWQTVRRIQDEQKQRLETAEAVAAAEVEELRTRLQNLTSAGQLAGVVQERAGAASYRERLGLMTQIRQDFERMAELLRPDEAAQSDVPVADAAGDELPAIDRIVIYIDDLDRCPPDRVVDVLEAVHLLLAVRLFVVVVAVDPRWLLRSLTSHYRELFAAAEGVQGDDELWAATPAQYLEKIFQIVLTLPPMQQDGYRKMIDDLVGLRTDADAGAGDAVGTPTAVPVVAVETAARLTAGEKPAAIRADLEERAAELEWRKPIDLNTRVVERVDPLALTPAEYELINLLGPPLVTGPRSVKRLANSYGLLVATATPSGLTTGLRPDLEPVPDLGGETPPYRAGMVLLAAVIGFPMLGPAFFPDLHHTAQTSPATPWTEYLAGLRPTANSNGNRAEPTMAASRTQQWNDFLAALTKVGQRATEVGQPLPQSIAIWAEWVIPVGRLSFPTGSSVARLITSN